MLDFFIFARGEWPYRGWRIGEASHPGPPHRRRSASEEVTARSQRETMELDDTQRESDGDAIPVGTHVGPAFEFVSPADAIPPHRMTLAEEEWAFGDTQVDGAVGVVVDELQMEDLNRCD